MRLTILLLCLALAACSPRNPLEEGDAGEVSTDPCAELVNDWPVFPDNFSDYTGDAPSIGGLAPNFRALDQHEEEACFSQLLGHAIILDFGTRWCAPCQEAADESMEVLEQAREIAPTMIATVMSQNHQGQNPSLQDAAEWAEEFELDYPVFVDAGQDIAALYEVGGQFPTFLFIAPTGQIIERLDVKAEPSDILGFVGQVAEEFGSFLRPTSE